jgi:hypothetical protein
VVHGDDLPPFGFGVHAAAPFVGCGRFSFGLVFGADANPDADSFTFFHAYGIFNVKLNK